MGLFSGIISIIGAGYLLGKDALSQRSARANAESYRRFLASAYSHAEKYGLFQEYERLKGDVEDDIRSKINQYYFFYSDKYASKVGMTTWLQDIIKREITKQSGEKCIPELLYTPGNSFGTYFDARFNDLYPPNKEELALWRSGEWKFNISRLNGIEARLRNIIFSLDLFDKIVDYYTKCYLISKSLNYFYNDDNFTENLITKEKCKRGKQEKILDAVFGGYEFTLRPAGYLVERIKTMKYQDEAEEALWPVSDEIKITALNQYYAKQRALKKARKEYDVRFVKDFKRAVRRVKRSGKVWPKTS